MKYFLISDNHDTAMGMRLAGIDGVVVHGVEATRQAILNAAADKSIGILLVSEKCAALCPQLVGEIKLTVATPLLVEIPDRHGTGRAPDSITRYVRESIGVKL